MANANGRAIIIPAGIAVSIIIALVSIGVAFGRDNGAIANVRKQVATLELDAKEDRATIAASLRELAADMATLKTDVQWIKRNGGRP